MLTQWAIRWQIPLQAVEELRYMMGVGAPHPTGSIPEGASESAVQSAVRLEAARRGARVFRNNSGVAMEDKRVIRYGLMNDSAKVNAVCKSSDLIGITPVVCKCGHTHGVFTAIECKRPGWVFRESDQRAVAQLNFINLIVSLGGIGKFVTSVEGY